MMKIRKLFWAVRACFYKLKFNKIGHQCYLGKPCYVDGGGYISIGNRTRIYPGLRMEAIGGGKISIGNNCSIQQNVHIISASDTNGVLTIEDNTVIAANVFITNCDHNYTDTSKSVMDQGLIYKDTKIGEGCFIGYGAVIQSGTKLGKHCIVGANAVVKGEFPDYCVIVGMPARTIKRYNVETKQWEKT